MLSEKVHESLLFIKKQLQFTTHPLRGVIERFKALFIKKNYVLLCLQTSQDSAEPLSDISFDKKIAYTQRMVQKMIDALVDAIILFYELDDAVKQSKLTKELFTNLITNLVLEGEMYFLVFNIMNQWLNPRQRDINKIMSNQKTLESLFPITSLNLKKQFQFDTDYRETFAKVEEQSVGAPKQFETFEI